MSSSGYSQGFQSCLEPTRMVEPRILRLKLAPSSKCSDTPFPPPTHDSDSDSKANKNADTGGWSFLQSLSCSSSTETTADKDKIYIPPSSRRSFSSLSEKSLEMCTESLGSETGSDGGESSDEMNLLSSENINFVQSSPKSRRRTNRTSNFPPPLTSISGSNNVHVKPHREGGRLVLQAVTFSPSHGYFHAERTNGRLRLHLVKDWQVKEEQCEEEEELGGQVAEEDDGIESGAEAEDEEADEKEYLEGNHRNAGAEIGMGNLARAGRCKEGESGNNGSMLNWEAFWVAT